MDAAYDHITESTLSPDEIEASQRTQNGQNNTNTLNNDFQEAYKAISSSPWGARLGGFFGSVVKQGEHIYKEATTELGEVGKDASKGWDELRSKVVSRTRSLSIQQAPAGTEGGEGASKDGEQKGDDASKAEAQESEGVLARLKSEAAKRLKEIEKAEDAADEALLKFGTNLRNFLRDAVTVAPPSDSDSKQGESTVLFESKDSSGKRVIHTTRFDAQLHAIHSSIDSFKSDPEGEEFTKWKEGFDVEKNTEQIGKDLEKYEELRGAMEKLVPGEVAYKDFWTRYYFLRHSIETAEERRKELLKGR
jgi:hypothetical protein